MTQPYNEDPYGYQPQAPITNTVLTAEGTTPEDYVTSMRLAGQDLTLTVRAKTEAELIDKVGALAASGAGARLGEAFQTIRTGFNLNAQLGATPVDSPAAAQQSYQQQNGAQNGYQAPQGGYQQPQQGYQPQQQAQQPSGPPAGPVPTCPHGQKNWVGPGVSKKTGKAYSGFWGCPAPQSAPDKCRPEWPKN